MLNLLLTLLVAAVVLGLIFWLLEMLPLPAPWGGAVRVIAILICLVVLITILMGGSIGLPFRFPRY